MSGPYRLLLVLHRLNAAEAFSVAERWLQLPWATKPQKDAASLFLAVD